MASELPSFLRPVQPAFLRPAPVIESCAKETRKLLLEQFALAFPRVIDRMCGGETLNKVLEDFPIPVERGAFMLWVKKDPLRYAQFKEAKEVRTEVWAGEMIRHALAEDPSLTAELDRSKFIVDTYKFLMKAENRREYGDTKQIEMTGNISITAALADASNRVAQISTFVDDDDESEPSYKQLSEVVEADWEESDDE